MQILGRLNMCLDAAVVFAPTLHFYSDLLCEYFVLGRDSPSGERTSSLRIECEPSVFDKAMYFIALVFETSTISDE